MFSGAQFRSGNTQRASLSCRLDQAYLLRNTVGYLLNKKSQTLACLADWLSATPDVLFAQLDLKRGVRSLSLIHI